MQIQVFVSDPAQQGAMLSSVTITSRTPSAPWQLLGNRLSEVSISPENAGNGSLSAALSLLSRWLFSGLVVFDSL